MRVLVTGAKGFIGKNLIMELRNREYYDIFEYDQDTNPSLLDEFCKQSDFVYHLAGVNRSEEQNKFMEGKSYKKINEIPKLLSSNDIILHSSRAK
jgi:UDP-2-acetamido-2,6-beta-L-arabino-hexul-4-ose reductase